MFDCYSPYVNIAEDGVLSLVCNASMVCMFQLTANVIIFLAVNITGIYVHDRCEHAQRKAFMDTRNCIAARIEMEDENEKLVSFVA